MGSRSFSTVNNLMREDGTPDVWRRPINEDRVLITVARIVSLDTKRRLTHPIYSDREKVGFIYGQQYQTQEQNVPDDDELPSDVPKLLPREDAEVLEEATQEANDEVDLPELLLTPEDMKDSNKVLARMEQLLDQELLHGYRYLSEIDQSIEAASPALMKQPEMSADTTATLTEYEARWDRFLLANARLVLSMTLSLANKYGINRSWYFFSVANARQEDRLRLRRRFCNPKNQPLDVQVLMAENKWSRQIVKLLRPVDTNDPDYDGSRYNTAYMVAVFLSDQKEMLFSYFGSATGSRGEEGRLEHHEEMLQQDHEDIISLRRNKKKKALFFYEIGTLPNASHAFYPLQRFPAVQDETVSGFSRFLAYVCEQANMIFTGTLCPTDAGSNLFSRTSATLLRYFKEEAQLVPCPQTNFMVLNKAYPMVQASNVFLNQSVVTGNYNNFIRIQDLVYEKLNQFYLDTRKRRLLYEDMRRIEIEHNLDLSLSSHERGSHIRIRTIYKNILKAHGEVYQEPFDELTLPTMAAVIRHASADGIIEAPDTPQSLYHIKTSLIDWQKVVIEAQKLLPAGLTRYCTPTEMQKIWTNGLKHDYGISLISLIPRNLHFLRDSFSGQQDEITIDFKPISGAMGEFILQLSRSELVQYLSNRKYGTPQIQVLEGRLSFTSPLSQPARHKTILILLQQTVAKFVKYIQHHHDVNFSSETLTNSADFMIWLRRSTGFSLDDVKSGLITSKIWESWSTPPVWPTLDNKGTATSKTPGSDCVWLQDFMSPGPSQPDQQVQTDLASLSSVVEQLQEYRPQPLQRIELLPVEMDKESSRKKEKGKSLEKSESFVFGRNVGEGNDLEFLYEFDKYCRALKEAPPTTLPGRLVKPRTQRPARPIPDDDTPLTCDEYIAQVYHRYDDNRNRDTDWSRKALSFPTSDIELSVLLKVAKARRAHAPGAGPVNINAITIQVLSEHGRPAPEGNAKQRVRSVHTMTQRVFKDEPQIQLLMSGASPSIGLKDNVQMYKIFRDYVCSQTDQNPDEEVDVTGWLWLQAQEKNALWNETAAGLTAKFREASGLRDSEYTVKPLSFKEMMRDDFSAIEQKYRSEWATRDDPGVDTLFECPKCKDLFLTEDGAKTCAKWKCLGQCRRCEEQGLSCDSQRLAGDKCSNCTASGADCELSVSPTFTCPGCKIIKAVPFQVVHRTICKSQCERCEQMGLRCRATGQTKKCLYCRDAGEVCIGGNAMGTNESGYL
ncbi:uncharacterized protein B0J16DRAFT_338806 [Fusarium flagelliforme]|uniref:uncharacterized protein n=1 Tax=Fusarium flagelliforme TaxID=2675880 RepID=UPI001E8DC2E8|nr:uncharacterized protein B0J16DRAFT_338806 [Fusarium flagelliforme]KAH7189090.1 hypothetical protein B0J16DRAFT_338806 [Fusarium flagelliforme]